MRPWAPDAGVGKLTATLCAQPTMGWRTKQISPRVNGRTVGGVPYSNENERLPTGLDTDKPPTRDAGSEKKDMEGQIKSSRKPQERQTASLSGVQTRVRTLGEGGRY